MMDFSIYPNSSIKNVNCFVGLHTLYLINMRVCRCVCVCVYIYIYIYIKLI